MADDRDIMQRLASSLGPDLSSACVQNDVTQFKVLNTSDATTTRSAAAVVAAFEHATDVLTYCFHEKGSSNIIDRALWWILEDERLDPAYRYLVESNIVDVNHEIERTGSMLGLLAGESQNKRHSLMQFLRQEGAIPNQRVAIEGGMYALTAAAGHSDVKMLGLLLDHGAEIDGTGALALAAQCGKEDNVKYLLSRGANVNEMVPYSDRGTTEERQQRVGSPLHKAVGNGHINVVDILLNSGADLKLKDGKGRTAAEIAAQKGADANIMAKLSQRERVVFP